MENLFSINYGCSHPQYENIGTIVIKLRGKLMCEKLTLSFTWPLPSI